MTQPVREFARKLYLTTPPLEQLSTADLWDLHNQGLAYFRSQQLPRRPEGPADSWLAIKCLLAERILQQCTFCVHTCTVNRKTGETGYCRLTSQAVVSGVYVHQGEEQAIRPTLAIFFSGCTMHCLYCHNWRETFTISAGQPITAEQLANAILAQEKQVKTLSVLGGTPEPHLHTLLATLKALPELNQPLVFNGNATLSPQGLDLMEGIVDIYLPDYKHGNDTCAWQLTYLRNYTASVHNNLLRYQQQRAHLIIRHLIVPNHMHCCTRPVLEWIAKFCPHATVSLLEQYRPLYKARFHQSINRRPSPMEYEQAQAWVQELNLKLCH